MWDWIKGIFNPKSIVKGAIDALDLFRTPLAREIERIKKEFDKKTADEQAQWLIDEVQSWLLARFGIK